MTLKPLAGVGLVVLFLGMTAGTPPVMAQDIDLDAIFRCAATDDAGKAACLEGRNLILNNCTVCHTFVPIVMQSFDVDGWTGLLDRHRQNGRVNQLSDAQVQAIHDYLSANFNGTLPPPELPPELLATWTSY
jgi:mono/diheme cytochrome c family protein